MKKEHPEQGMSSSPGAGGRGAGGGGPGTAPPRTHRPSPAQPQQLDPARQQLEAALGPARPGGAPRPVTPGSPPACHPLTPPARTLISKVYLTF